MTRGYCQKPFEFWILVQPAFSLNELQILIGELGTCMRGFKGTMIDFFGGSFKSECFAANLFS